MQNLSMISFSDPMSYSRLVAMERFFLLHAEWKKILSLF